MKLTRTYPQPDSPQPNLGARERALNTFKYLLDLEPEQATQHPRFAVMVHAFEQSERRGWNKAACEADDRLRGRSIAIEGLLLESLELDRSYCDEIKSAVEAQLRPLPPSEPFIPDGI